MSDCYHTIIYSKSQNPPPGAKPLPNVGLESNTYLSHIIDKYDDLGEYTLFTQAEPFDHVPNFIEILGEENLEGMWKTNCKIFPNSRMRSRSLIGFGDYRLIDETLVHENDHDEFKEFHRQKHEYIQKIIKTVDPSLISTRPLPCVWGQIYLVAANLIHSRSRDTYRRIFDIGDEMGWSIFPYAMENAWWAVWNEEGALWNGSPNTVVD